MRRNCFYDRALIRIRLERPVALAGEFFNRSVRTTARGKKSPPRSRQTPERAIQRNCARYWLALDVNRTAKSVDNRRELVRRKSASAPPKSKLEKRSIRHWDRAQVTN
jgi:hypothetical protein